MKCLAGMVAVVLVSAAHSQTPAVEQAPPESQAARAAAPATVNATPAGDTAPAAANGTTPAATTTVPAADVATALSYLKSAIADFTHCRRASTCNTYFETFGVALSFNNGSIAPYSHVQRLTATSRDCIKKAKALLEEGDRTLAVQWAMAARVENRRVLDWMGSHPDAVLEALRQVTVV